MKFKLPFDSKTIWPNNKPFAWFAVSLLLLYALLKIIFYQYNRLILFPGTGAPALLPLLKWSFLYDLLTVLGINSFLLFALTLGRLVHSKMSGWLVIPVFVLVNSFALVLNLVDIFYFRFHFQRANADLLYVLDHPLSRLKQLPVFPLLLSIGVVAGIVYLMWVLHHRLFRSFLLGFHNKMFTAALFILLGLPFAFPHVFSKYLVPTYPMISLQAQELPVVQNSFHSFLYSLFRTGKGFPRQDYMPAAETDILMPIRKSLKSSTAFPGKKNVVLFIMESVPYDFFDPSGPYKVTLPFFDSLLKKSWFFTNAFAYSHESNKGITAILAGTPTVTDMPVYHSPFVNMPVTRLGAELRKAGYHSLFCIGDEFDNFGFAKCMNWLGIDTYYSKEAIPGHKKLPAHSMGLQDEAVLRFFEGKISEQPKPFVAVHYNISTHYPYDIPDSFSNSLPKSYTAPMRSMRYYDHSLEQFFQAAEKKPWFANTLFIFCSDHWLVPDDTKTEFNAVSGYHIPLILYDAAEGRAETIGQPVGQFDILGTILAAAGIRDSMIGYGGNLLDRASLSPYVYSKPNSSLYQVADSAYVLGYNIAGNRSEYLYQYTADSRLERNLVNDDKAAPVKERLSRQVRAFLQKAKMQYGGQAFK